MIEQPVPTSKAQLVWELLNASLYDIATDNNADAVAAIEEAINLIEGETK